MYKNDALQLSIVQRVYVVGCESMRSLLTALALHTF